MVLRYQRRSPRVYFVLPRPEHADRMNPVSTDSWIPRGARAALLISNRSIADDIWRPGRALRGTAYRLQWPPRKCSETA